ncbi:MAG: hypothetical protein WA777_05890 [Rhodanobacter sp.]
MKPEAVRIPVMTDPRSESAPRKHVHAGSLDGYHYDDARVRGVGLTHLFGSGYVGASGHMPLLWQRHTQAFAAAHPEP